jgi:hypothetical protein
MAAAVATRRRDPIPKRKQLRYFLDALRDAIGMRPLYSKGRPRSKNSGTAERSEAPGHA